MNKQPLAALRRKARHYAIQAMYQWQMAGAPLHQIEAEFRTDNDMSDVDLEYFHELLHQVPALVGELDDVIRPLVDRDMKDLGPVELAILRVGVYELAHRIDVPFKVVISEAVSLAKKFGATDSHKYINGVLDKAAQTQRMVEIKASGPR